VALACRAPSSEPTSPEPEPETPPPQSDLHIVQPDERVIDEGRSEFNHVIVTERGSLRLMYFETDGRWLLQSTYDRTRPDALHHEVFQTMVSALVVQPKARRICMVGVGGGQVTNYLFRHLKGAEIDVVDICPEVIRMARAHFDMPDHPHYRAHVEDGRVFVERLPPQSVDLLILDAYRGHSIPRHLRTQEFFSACARALAPGGVVVANMHRRTPRYPVDRATVASVFEHVYRFSSPDDVQTSVVATMAPAALSAERLVENARALQPRFDIDLVALATRVRLDEGGWDPAAIPRDEFTPEGLEGAAREHNLSCAPRCAGDGAGPVTVPPAE
jgi:spermidine synthase